MAPSTSTAGTVTSAPADTGNGQAKAVPLTDGCEVERYLVEVRKLDPLVLQSRVAQSVDGKSIVYPYYAPAKEEDEFLKEGSAKRGPSWAKFELLERVR